MPSPIVCICSGRWWQPAQPVYEPYRDAVPDTLPHKFNRLRKSAGETSGRRSADLATTCRDAGLSSPLCFDELRAGERRVLAETETEGFARQVSSRADAE
ncbi:hypothetical protein ACERK3_18660 [Phycisphaerales bacterium AB-hyl4]|uniref:Uncharacterized protein n=1 Tax=Natronomicrosphaera hydrolytica TaxID=3242702 RepID=A0ABV4U9L2_9BACT